MHYTLFLADKSDETGSIEANLAAVGLADLLRDDDQPPRRAEMANAGPGGRPGQLVTWVSDDVEHRDRNGDLAYRPKADNQVWQPAPPDPQLDLPAGRYWFGINSDQPPRPEDLARKTLYAGDEALLGPDDNEQHWIVPNAFRLPHTFAHDVQTGQLTQVPRRKVRPIYDRTQQMFGRLKDELDYEALLHKQLTDAERDELLARNPQPVFMDEYFAYCADMLALNYRLNPNIATWLELFHPDNVFACAALTTDFLNIGRLYEELKKKPDRGTDASPASSSGDPNPS